MKVPIIAAALCLCGTRAALPDPCPQPKMIGILTTPAPHESTQNMRVVANGKVLLMGAGKAITGHAKMTCQGGKFTAEFTSMSDRHKYRCDGDYSGGSFRGTCKLDGGMRDIAGRFER